MIDEKNSDSETSERVIHRQSILVLSKGLKKRVFASDDVHVEAVASVPDFHLANSGFWSAAETHRSLADQTAGHVEAYIAFNVRREEAFDNFG